MENTIQKLMTDSQDLHRIDFISNVLDTLRQADYSIDEASDLLSFLGDFNTVGGLLYFICNKGISRKVTESWEFLEAVNQYEGSAEEFLNALTEELEANNLIMESMIAEAESMEDDAEYEDPDAALASDEAVDPTPLAYSPEELEEEYEAEMGTDVVTQEAELANVEDVTLEDESELEDAGPEAVTENEEDLEVEDSSEEESDAPEETSDIDDTVATEAVEETEAEAEVEVEVEDSTVETGEAEVVEAEATPENEEDMAESEDQVEDVQPEPSVVQSDAETETTDEPEPAPAPVEAAPTQEEIVAKQEADAVAHDDAVKANMTPPPAAPVETDNVVPLENTEVVEGTVPTPPTA